MNRHKPLSILTLAGSLVAIVLLLIAVFGHRWLVAEVSMPFMTAREELGLFSVKQYYHTGGGDSKEQVYTSTQSLAEWEDKFCHSRESSTFFDRPCLWASALRWSGLYCAIVGLLSTVMYVLVVLDLRQAQHISDSLEPHLSPITRQSVNDGCSAHLGLGGSDFPRVSAYSVNYTETHPGAQNAEDATAYHQISGGALRPPPPPQQNSFMSDSFSGMPTILQLRTVGTVDMSLYEGLSYTALDSLSRVKRRLKVTSWGLATIIILWAIIFVEARFYRDDLLKSLPGSTFLAGPVLVKLSVSYYIIAVTLANSILVYACQPQLLKREFWSVLRRSGATPQPRQPTPTFQRSLNEGQGGFTVVT